MKKGYKGHKEPYFFIVGHIDITSCVDDNKLHVVADNINDFIISLKEACTALFQWFNNSFLKSNPGNCRLLTSCNENVKVKPEVVMKTWT